MQSLRSRIVLLGNIVSKQLVVRYFADGQAITHFDIEVKSRAADGESKHYFSIQAKGELAERLSQGAVAGQGIHLEGYYHQQLNKQNQLVSSITATNADLIGTATKLYWNRSELVGQVVKRSALAKSTNDREFIKLSLDVGSNAPIDCQLWGFPAKYLDQHGGEGSQLLLEGELRMVRGKSTDEKSVLLHGHTCIKINNPS
ncbi:single-stranded DNA-binding protein [Aliagarivorans taiwanensis]|uniref:single-stranded DNA-binding protein n=1 Tax=Aliagarivorans taiwanensis TaxID=561966 RepID=UPI00042287B7|nr:single-stranded DNA-binding protein [Aliagarivorans taiwanensis]